MSIKLESPETNETSNSKYAYWQSRRHKIETSLGQWRAGDGVSLRGRELLGELIQECSQTQLIVFAVTGRLISPELALWIEKARFMTAYPDCRIWCNSIASIMGGQGTSPVAAAAAGMLSADSNAYGSRVLLHISHTLNTLLDHYHTHNDFELLVDKFPKRMGQPSIPGFVRPVQVKDERIEPVDKVTQSLGLEKGSYLQFAEKFSDYLSATYQSGMNGGGYYCALLMDHNFTPAEIYLLTSDSVEAGVFACFQDHQQDKPNGFLPLHCTDIEYVGPAKKSL